MFHHIDTETLRLCSVLASTAFGLVFALVRFDVDGRRYCYHWSASSLLYAATLIGFEYAPGHPYFKAALLGALAFTNVLIIAGLRVFDGKTPFRAWMAWPVAGCVVAHLAPQLLLRDPKLAAVATEVCDTFTVAISAGIVGVSCFVGLHRERANAAADSTFMPSRGRRLAGLAMLGYLPGYAIAIAGYLWNGPTLDLLALVPMLSDQLLLGVLNLGLLAMPAERAQQRLRAAALRDPLTGVWNRAGFEAQSRRLIAPGATLLAIDLDHFKQINDRHGHLAGDSVLKAAAALAGAEVESLGGEFGRMGGDEFLAVLPAERAPYAQVCARQIQQACRRPLDGLPPWTASIGLAQVEAGETELAAALQRADRALYRAKVDGRDTVTA